MTRLLSICFLFATLASSVLAQNGFPTVLTHVPPVYPAAARAVRASSDVQLSVEVDSDGKIISVKSLSGHPLLRRAAEIAVENWKFSATAGRHFLHITIMFRSGSGKSDVIFVRSPFNLTITSRKPELIAP